MCLVCVSVQGVPESEKWLWGLFLWGVAVPVCFLCPFQPFHLEATWSARDYIFSPNCVSELAVLGESSEAAERLYVSVCMCGGAVGVLFARDKVSHL